MGPLVILSLCFEAISNALRGECLSIGVHRGRVESLCIRIQIGCLRASLQRAHCFRDAAAMSTACVLHGLLYESHLCGGLATVDIILVITCGLEDVSSF